jgi:acetyl-CoA carboxylase biotin carboxyl carrier protein
MDDREQMPQRADTATEVLREAVDQAKQLAIALEHTSTRRIFVRAGNAEISIERETRPTPSQESSMAAQAPATTHAALLPIVAPLVGIFYRAASPNARPFVELGDTVEAGQVIGIIEAMKVMNQVISDHDGRVVQILAENGSTVQYEQPLVLLDTSHAARAANLP